MQIVSPTPTTLKSTVLFLESSPLPNGLQLAVASGGDDPGKQAFANGDGPPQRPGTAQLWAKINEHGEALATFLLNSLALNEKDMRKGQQGVDIRVRGHFGRYDENSGTLVWQEAPKVVLALLFGKAMPAHGAQFSLENALAIANNLVEVNGRWTITNPPLDFEPIAIKATQYSFGTNPRVLGYSSPSGGIVVHIADNSQVPPLWYLALPGARRVSVHDTDAVFVPTAGGAGEQIDAILTRPATSTLIWNETDRAQVRVFGVGLTQAELIAFAQSLRSISTERWIELVHSTGGTFEQRQTTTTTAPIRRTDPNLLRNTTWTLQYVDDESGHHQTLNPKPTAQFADGRATFHGCNYISAEVTLGAATIRTPGVFGSTLVLCQSEPAERDAPLRTENLDAVFRHVFGDSNKQGLSTWFIDDRGLHISDAAGRVHMVFT